jgi:tetratricopeptide (TPR) repeat protein
VDPRARNGVELANLAISEIRAFLKSNKYDPEALLDLGFLLNEINDIDGAISCYEQALEVDPGNETARRLLARVYADKGLMDKAMNLRVNAPLDSDGFHPRVSDLDARARELMLSGNISRILNI